MLKATANAVSWNVIGRGLVEVEYFASQNLNCQNCQESRLAVWPFGRVGHMAIDRSGEGEL